MIFGVLADDTTGANDVGVAFQKGGAGVKVVAHESEGRIIPDEDVVVVDTNSRLDRPEIAYAKVHAATSQLKATGTLLFYKKACSVFRGNIGSEFDAMLDASGLTSMIISLAYPKNGRTTIEGQQFVYGKPLQDTNFRNDPVHPMLTSDLREIIQQQSQRSSINIPLQVVRQGATSLKKVLEQERQRHAFLIVDGETQSDIEILAEAAQGFKAFGGSAALGEVLPQYLGELDGPQGLDPSILSGSGATLVACGSLTPQTKEQTRMLIDSGILYSELDSTTIFDPSSCSSWIEETVRHARESLTSGKDFLIFASQDAQKISETKSLAKAAGMDDAALGRKISGLQAEAVFRILENAPPFPLVVAGGDTSGSICERLNIRGNRIIEEIDTGVPLGLTLDHPRLLTLKSGSFGKPDFLLRTIKRIHQLSRS